MDDLDALFAETELDTNVEIPVPVPTSTHKRKDDGQASSTRQELKSKPNSSNAPKVTEPRKKKRKDAEKNTSQVGSPPGPSGPAEASQPGADKGRGTGIRPEKRLKSVADSAEEVTAADFAAMAKVARLGAEAFEKMRKTIQVNTPENLAGMYSETQAYNHRLARKLAWVHLELKYARHEYVELLKENREIQAECEKNTDLLNRLIAAEKQAAENKKKVADLDKVFGDLQAARNELAQARKDAKAVETKAEEAEKKCQALKKSNAEMAKLGYTRCLSQVLVLDPDFPVNRVHLTQRVENDKILGRDGQVVYAPPEIEEKAAEEDENAAGGEEGTLGANQETPKENAGEN